MMIIPSAANGDLGIAIVFVITGLVVGGVLYKNKNTSDEETWLESFKNLFGWLFVWLILGPLGAALIFYILFGENLLSWIFE